MDDSERIDNLIHTMKELKDLMRELDDPRTDIDMIIGTMIALIICADVPNVTILPTSSITNEIAQA
tara:strand:- start:16592 stop:16789 length:198 start_codon:yes stop_codon:yes gene_type:complete